MVALVLRIEVEREDDGRFVAEVVTPGFEGILAYGQMPLEAVVRVVRLAREVALERLAAGEAVVIPV